MRRLILHGGEVVDGTGKARFSADVVVEDGRITGIGPGLDASTGDDEQSDGHDFQVMDVTGCIIAPGFIDMHTHSDFSALALPNADSKTAQGVTTEVTGQCGASAFPVCADSAADLLRQAALWKLELDWQDCAGYLERLRRSGSAINHVSFVGHGTLRSSVVDGEARPLSREEERRMCDLAREAFDQGAAGLSAGLTYPPGCYSTSDELAAAGAVAAEYGKPFSFHVRDEGEHCLDALGEVLGIASRTGCHVHVSHLKAAGPSNWPLMDKVLDRIRGARDEGVQVTADVYPYIASHTSLGIILPHWVKEGGQVAMVERLRSKGMRDKIARELRERVYPDYWKRVSVSMVEKESLAGLSGRTIAEIAAERRAEPVELAMDLISETHGGISAVFFSMSRDNLIKVIREPYVAIASDASALPFDENLMTGKPHPRGFGTFPRVFARMVREDSVLELEEAVRRMTSLPAGILGLEGRGALAEGNVADLAVFDEKGFSDTASFKNPVRSPEGLRAVIVSGGIIYEEGRFTNERPGHVL